MPSNCVSRLWPSISAVMPVPSETKNTVRLGGDFFKWGSEWANGTGKAGEALVCAVQRAPVKYRLSIITSMGWIRMAQAGYVLNFETLRMGDVERVGGKNASLGEMISQLSKAG